ncbi:MAG TPA: hypothetical protein VHN79_07665, partial [Lacunisphaera sp.]|nr:hypothetical protein [Lacunisphaera sp.]
MKRPRWIKTAAWALVASLAGATAWGQTFTWTGIGNGWANQTPPDGGGDDIILLSDAIDTRIDLSALGSSLAIQSMSIDFSDAYVLGASSPFTLSVSQGIFGTPSDNASLRFNAEVTVALSGTPTISAGASGRSFHFFGQLTGSPTTLTLAGPNNSNLWFNNAGNTYTGNTVIGSAAGTPSLFIWNSSPFGTGDVSFYQHGFLGINGAQTITNNLTVGTGAAGNLTLRSYSDPIVYSGSVTLANNTTLSTNVGSPVIDFANGMGSLLIPGLIERNPHLFTGNVGESGGSRMLTVAGPGITILNPTMGTNTYTGGTNVTGTLVFGSLAAIPATGVVQAGAVNTSNAGGYVGLADVTPGNFATFLARIQNTANGANSSGSVGVDTLPGDSIVTLTDAINLSGFTTTAGNGMRLGTATQAIITGAITPDNLANY